MFRVNSRKNPHVPLYLPSAPNKLGGRGLTFARISSLTALLLLTACGAPEPMQQDRFYSLEPEIQPAPATSTALGATLLVNDLATRGFLGGRQIVYQTSEQPLQVHRYHLLLWAEPPGRAIAWGLARALGTAGLFEVVATPAQRVRSDFILGGELDRFEHLPTAAPPKVVADFSLTLVRSTDHRALFSRGYQGQEPTQGDSPEAMARAFNRLAGRLIGEAVRDIQALRTRLHSQPARP